MYKIILCKFGFSSYLSLYPVIHSCVLCVIMYSVCQKISILFALSDLNISISTMTTLVYSDSLSFELAFASYQCY